MQNALTLLEIGRTRGQSAKMPYAGALTPTETFALLTADPLTLLVDVRTNAERDWVGRVSINESQHVAVQWTQYPGGAPNPDFLSQLARVAEKGTTLVFLCRSGVRSRHAATFATEHGYSNSFDILEGFEGDKDAAGHRKSVSGWCKADLPWIGA
ncbi:rhodanese-like domain-containing protein [Glaciimonas immobilis]|uniref:Rhodanese-related sulfurtransferase n=1 Tax=Glaciimonas immobilis TaxID=728004 RepID=A0A840RSW1_9BURK|nr:rhodanese-like domain-containing protein [Glaciimonas immobilis]KAF3997813.1 rhodanese-like domain-containing protein [Glaciimonas immobilis]MBB5199559.1 rhodanese-related sulfurtransferase [Glaciimonas immobilis]